MMEKLPNIRALYAHFQEPENQRRLAEMCWPIIMICMSIGVVCSIAYGAWEYVTPAYVEEATQVSNTGGVTLDANDIHSAVEALEKGRRDFEALLSQ